MKLHGWTPENMDRCREIFMEDITFYYWNMVDEDFRKEKIYSLIEEYSKYKADVSQMARRKEVLFRKFK